MVQSNAMSTSKSVRASAVVGREFTRGRSRHPGGFVRLSTLRELRECEQVAAVCYRLRNGNIEFLLVRTRGSGRWTFPKGSTEPGLTHAQAAALEAYEEAGVHGRIEETAFASYGSARPAQKNVTVSAHLCEVVRLSAPKESDRDRTWFQPGEAKRRLRERRDDTNAIEFTRVIEKAVTRIQRAREQNHRKLGANGIATRGRSASLTVAKDQMQEVRFEASFSAWQRTFASRPMQKIGTMRRLSEIAINPAKQLAGVIQMSPSPLRQNAAGESGAAPKAALHPQKKKIRNPAEGFRRG